MLILGLVLFVTALGLSAMGTAIALRLAPHLGMMDQPGQRKVHVSAKPRNGGMAIFCGIGLPLLAAIIFTPLLQQPWLAHLLPTSVIVEIPGLLAHRGLALVLLLCTGAIHLLGLFDDHRPMAAVPKLVGQLVIAGALVIGGEIAAPGGFRILTLLDHLFPGGEIISGIASVLWVVILTNAFNFMDNMDGLSAGVAFICGLMFFLAALHAGQWFIGGLLLLYLGATLGFLFYNFPPAAIFMGDGGSMVLGFFLAALTIRTTYYHSGARWWAIFMPLIVTAVPLYDFFVIIVIRLWRHRSPMQGDANHFSHRLTRHGFTQRGAVMVIYAVTLASGLSAPLLALTNNDGAILIATQCVAILVVVGILERVGDHLI